MGSKQNQEIGLFVGFVGGWWRANVQPLKKEMQRPWNRAAAAGQREAADSGQCASTDTHRRPSVADQARAVPVPVRSASNDNTLGKASPSACSVDILFRRLS